MVEPSRRPELTSLEPVRVVEGGRLWLRGDGFPQPETTADLVTIGLRSAPESWRDYLYWNLELDEDDG